METIKELYNEGRLSARAHNAILRNVHWSFSRIIYAYDVAHRVSHEFADNITIKTLFELYGEDGIKKWKGVGAGVMEELKGLL